MVANLVSHVFVLIAFYARIKDVIPRYDVRMPPELGTETMEAGAIDDFHSSSLWLQIDAQPDCWQ
jgi:hypothetical protein